MADEFPGSQRPARANRQPRLAWQVVRFGLPFVFVLALLDWVAAWSLDRDHRIDRLEALGRLAADDANVGWTGLPSPLESSSFETGEPAGRILEVDPASGLIRLVDRDGVGRMLRFDPVEVDRLDQTATLGPTLAVLAGGLGTLVTAGLLTQRRISRRLNRIALEAADRLDLPLEVAGDEIATLDLAVRSSLDRLEAEVVERQRLAQVAEKTSNVVVITDERRRITWVNEGFTRISGYSLEEVRGQVPGQILQTEETDPATVQRIRDGLNRCEPVKETIFNRGKDGQGYWLSLDIHPVFDETSDLVGFVAVESDITELKNVQERLADTERRLRMVIEGADLGTWEWNIETGEVAFNDRWCRMLGYEPEEIEPHVRSWELVVHPEDMDSAMGALQDHFEGRTETYRCEHRLRHKDGSVIWVLDAGRVHEWDDEGKPIKASGIHLDITEARETARRFELAAAGASVGIWDWDIATGEVHLSPRWKEILGYRDDELPSTYESWHDHLHPDDRDQAIAAIQRHLQAREPYELEYRMRCRDGSYRWVHARGQASWGFDERPVRMAGSLADIHDRKLVELASQRLAAIVENSEDAVLGLGLDGTIEIANPASETLFGHAPTDLVGRNESMLIPPGERETELAYAARIAAGERVPPRESRRLRSDGREIEVSITMSVVRDEREEIVGYAKIVRDITERREKRALQESHAALASLNSLLAQKNARLEEMTDRAHRFVDDVSHEFRTPLTVIKEYTSLILDGLGGDITADQEDWLQTIDVATVDLNTMVEDFLDSSKLRVDRLRVDRRALEVPGLLHDVERLLDRKAAAAGVTLRFDCEDGMPAAFADLEKARRIVINLATNAIKFSPRDSEVRITARNLGEDIEIAVRDRGPGLSDADRASLFERFRQLPSAMSPSVKGFGLGLSIARQLVWLNLGRIDVDSEVGRGSTFRFTLPVDRPEIIVDRFLENLHEREDRPARIGVVGVSPNGVHDLKRLQNLLVAVCRPTDIRLASADGDRLVIFGPVDDVDSWRRRLIADLEEERGPDDPPIVVETIADAGFPDGIEDLRSRILAAIGRDRRALRA